LDTKWKNLNGYNPFPDDLRQMYVYHEYYNAKWVALIYPGIESSKSGVYFKTKKGEEPNKECSVISLSVDKDIKKWQKYINERFETWMLAGIES
jgi:5-methylcytosine-specific restriction enzyme subunit McrC